MYMRITQVADLMMSAQHSMLKVLWHVLTRNYSSINTRVPHYGFVRGVLTIEQTPAERDQIDDVEAGSMG